MEFWSILWDDEDDPDGNMQHVAEHGLTIGDVEFVVRNPTSEGTSKSSGLPAVWGFTPDGRHILVVFEDVDEDTIRVVTAYEVPEEKRKKKKRR